MLTWLGQTAFPRVMLPVRVHHKGDSCQLWRADRKQEHLVTPAHCLRHKAAAGSTPARLPQDLQLL